MKENNSVRNKSIDCLKGIGIIFVILGHMQRYIPTNLVIYIYSFHMPLFFYISGYLYKKTYEEKKIKEYIKKRAKELLYPYISLSIVNFVWYILKNRSVVNLSKYLLSFAYSNYIFDVNYVGAVWFLLCLFVVEVCYFILKKKIINEKIFTVIISVLLFIGIIIVEFANFRLPFWIDIALFGIFFYHIGNLLKRWKEKNILRIEQKIILLIICVIFSIITIVLNYSNCYNEKLLGRVDLLYLNVGNYLYFIIASILGIFTWHIIAEIINENKILEICGRNTLLIMGIHIIILQIFGKLIDIINLGLYDWIKNLIIFGTTLIFSVICSIIIKKYMPWIINYNGWKRKREDEC